VDYAKRNIPGAEPYSTQELATTVARMKEAGVLVMVSKSWFNASGKRKAQGLEYVDPEGSASGSVFGDKSETDPFG